MPQLNSTQKDAIVKAFRLTAPVIQARELEQARLEDKDLEAVKARQQEHFKAHVRYLLDEIDFNELLRLTTSKE